jgi:transglutaminase-like putative cysteine protease
MNLRFLHRRLAVLMGVTGLVAFAGGAGFEPLSALLAAIGLGTALFWHPDPDLSARMERVWLPLAALLVARALVHVFVIQDDVVIPVVDLLLLLMTAEALRSLDAPNDIRLYALSFALVLASTAYRPGIVFLVAFVAYIGLSTLALMVGHLRRKAEKHGVREVPLGRGLITTTVALSVVTLGVALVVFVAFPRVSRGWAGRGETLATSITGFSDQVSIGEFGSTIAGNPEIVLRVEFPDGPPEDINSLHWRGRSYDRFDGVRWGRSRVPPSAGPSSWYRDRWPGEVIAQQIYGAPLDVRVLFTLPPVLDIESDNGIQPLFDNAGDFIYWGSGAPAYTAYSRIGTPHPDSLRAAQDGYNPSRRYFSQLQDDLDPRIPALVDSLTTGLTNDYDRTIAVLNHLQSFQYTLDLPARADQTSLEYFLFDRQAGHCEYFSTAMAVMLRTAGLRTRNVNGFLGGAWSQFGNYLVVTQNEAHSWVEVWFPEYGWVTFDPTPGGAVAGSREANWFWPGQIFFDGLQHRWNKWVLDFSVDDQTSIFQRWSDMLGSQSQEQTQSTTTDSPGPSPWGIAIMLMLLAAGIYWARTGRAELPQATRMYLQLRASCERAGMVVTPGLTPLALVRRVEAHRASAAHPAERVVDLYLRARYAGRTLGESELNEMRQALGAARKSLKGGAS